MYFNQKSILAADYLRLSREDGDKLESDSIRNQRSLINDFVKQHPDITLVDEYIDDGYSGTNFERPAFKRLLEDVKKKKKGLRPLSSVLRACRNTVKRGSSLSGTVSSGPFRVPAAPAVALPASVPFPPSVPLPSSPGTVPLPRSRAPRPNG